MTNPTAAGDLECVEVVITAESAEWLADFTASSSMVMPSARAMVFATDSVGCVSPVSYRRICRRSTPTFVARLAWDMPSSLRRWRMTSCISMWSTRERGR